ncbi:peptidase S1, partial [Micromonospora sp. ATA51]|nr:peptidase S1 [Micromonospora sp. ATA51]
MTEYETDPQRSPAPADAEPSHSTAELPPVERGQSDSTPPADAPVPADSPAAGTTAAAAPDPTAAGRPATPAPREPVRSAHGDPVR